MFYPVLIPLKRLTLSCDDNSTREKCTIPTHDDKKKKQSGTAVIVTPPNKTRVSICELSAHTEDSCPCWQVSSTCARGIFDPPEGRIRWRRGGQKGRKRERERKRERGNDDVNEVLILALLRDELYVVIEEPPPRLQLAAR